MYVQNIQNAEHVECGRHTTTAVELAARFQSCVSVRRRRATRVAMLSQEPDPSDNADMGREATPTCDGGAEDASASIRSRKASRSSAGMSSMGTWKRAGTMEIRWRPSMASSCSGVIGTNGRSPTAGARDCNLRNEYAGTSSEGMRIASKARCHVSN